MPYNKKRKQFSTGLFIEPENWDANTQVTNEVQINNQLELLSLK